MALTSPFLLALLLLHCLPPPLNLSLTLKTDAVSTRETQSVKYLPGKSKDLSSIPRPQVRSLAWWRALVIPAGQKRIQRIPGAQ